MGLAASEDHFKGSGQCLQQRVARVTLEPWNTGGAALWELWKPGRWGAPKAWVPEPYTGGLGGERCRRPGS